MKKVHNGRHESVTFTFDVVGSAPKSCTVGMVPYRTAKTMRSHKSQICGLRCSHQSTVHGATGRMYFQLFCFLSSLPLPFSHHGSIWLLPVLSLLLATSYRGCGLAYPYDWTGFVGVKRPPGINSSVTYVGLGGGGSPIHKWEGEGQRGRDFRISAINLSFLFSNSGENKRAV